MILHQIISDSDVRKHIKQQTICFGGNNKLKIYGLLQCKSGKRLKRTNRVFFATETEAIQNGFRPCGHCMKSRYQKWKHGLI